MKYNNENTIYYDQVGVRNIIYYNDVIYFLSVHDKCPIYSYNLKKQELTNITVGKVTGRFSLKNDKIYFIDQKSCLCSINLETLKVDELVENVYTYNIYDDKIYYYQKLEDNSIRLYVTQQ